MMWADIVLGTIAVIGKLFLSALQCSAAALNVALFGTPVLKVQYISF